MICVTTRFHLKHFWTLLPMYLTYRRMWSELKEAPGLIRFAFLVQSPVACCTFSIWESEDALVKFSNVPNHVKAVRSAKHWCRDIWSAYWHLDAVSKYAQEWRGQGQGQGQWPTLMPHVDFPWRLVPLSTREEVKR